METDLGSNPVLLLVNHVSFSLVQNRDNYSLRIVVVGIMLMYVFSMLATHYSHQCLGYHSGPSGSESLLGVKSRHHFLCYSSLAILTGIMGSLGSGPLN